MVVYQVFIEFLKRFQTRLSPQKRQKIRFLVPKTPQKTLFLPHFSSKITKKRSFSSKNRVEKHNTIKFSAVFVPGVVQLADGYRTKRWRKIIRKYSVMSSMLFQWLGTIELHFVLVT